MEEKKKQSWFWKWVLNNKLVSILSVILLMLLIVLVASKVSFIFAPIQQFLMIIGAPILVSGILFYLMNPVINWAERQFKCPRSVSIWALFILILVLITWGIFNLVPIVQTQFHSLVINIPHYWNMVATIVTDYLGKINVAEIPSLDKMNQNIYQSLANFGKNLFSNGFQGFSSMFSVVSSLVVTIITVPFILFYLLRDGKQLMPYVLKFIPPKFKAKTTEVMVDINHQLASYIRGQITIAFCVSIIYMIGFSICGFKYSIIMGIIAGFLNIIPYLGSWFTMVPVVIIALVTAGPIMVIKVIIVHLIEQVLESRVLQPLIIGNQMEMHPLTIIFVILTAGKLFGLVGVILGIPGYAVLKVLLTHIFDWYRSVSELYSE